VHPRNFQIDAIVSRCSSHKNINHKPSST